MKPMNRNDTQGTTASKGTESVVSVTPDELDEIFSILSNSRRRAAIRTILKHGRMDKAELVDRISEIEYEKPIEEISGVERHRVYTATVQTHLPALEEKGVIVMDHNDVVAGPRAATIFDVLHCAAVDEGNTTDEPVAVGFF